MPNAPYTNPPTSPQVKNDADAIYFGWMGLAQDATFRNNMALIIRTGIVSALSDPLVIAALTTATCEGIKCGLTDAGVSGALTADIQTALENAVNALIASGAIPSGDDYKVMAILIAIGAASIKRGSFVQASDSPSINQLSADAQQILGVLFP